MRTAFSVACIATLALWIAGCTTSPQAPAGQPLLGKAAVFSTQATVVAADYATRELTLEVPNKPGDNFFDVYVGEDFGDLSEVRLGDRLTVSYIEAVFVDLFRPGDVDPGIGFAEAIGTAPPHQRPARAVAEGVSVVAVVEGIDRANELVALEGPKGVEKVLKVRNPEILARLQVGDKVKTTFARALILRIGPNPAS
jgi:hypothetical protein